MLLRSGYETKQTFKYDSNGWVSIASGWEFKKEVREMRERLKKMNEEEEEKKMTKADWIKYHSEELLEGLVQSGKVIWEMGGERIVRE